MKAMNKFLFFISIFFLALSDVTHAQAMSEPQMDTPLAQASVYFHSKNKTPPLKIEGPHARSFTQDEGAIFQNDVITTDAYQTVKIVFQDQSEIWVTPQSKIFIQQYVNQTKKRSAQLYLEKGLVRALVIRNENDKIQFQLKTKTATMGVRGTEFIAQIDANLKTTLYTLDGTVAFGKTPKDLESEMSYRLVKKGKKSEITTEAALPSVANKYNPKELEKILLSLSPQLAKSIDDAKQQRKALADAKAKTAPPPPKPAQPSTVVPKPPVKPKKSENTK